MPKEISSPDASASVFSMISSDFCLKPFLSLCTFDSCVFLIEIDATASLKDDGWLTGEHTAGDSRSWTSLQIIFLALKEVSVRVKWTFMYRKREREKEREKEFLNF